MKLRAILLLAAATGLATMLGSTVPAFAESAPATTSAATFAKEATSYQNAVIKQYAANVRGAVRTSPSQEKLPNGMILNVSAAPVKATAEPAATPLCPAGYFCAYPAPYTGYWYELPNYILNGGVYFYAWGAPGDPGYDVGIHSWSNNTGYRVWLEQNIDAGNELCISNHGSNTDYNGTDDDDYWIYVSSNAAAC
jgi:hypothetical protein